MAFIFVLSSISSPPELPGRNLDKVVHAFMYAVLGALLVRALAGGWDRPVTLRMALVAVLLATLYGLTDEIHQAFVPARQSDPIDLVADGLGAAVAAAAMYAGIIRGRHGPGGPDGPDGA
jgi:VanZ family protein